MQNRVPDSLYHAGVQKDRMSGFLDALKMRCDVVEVDGGRDFRRDEGHQDVHDGIRWYDKTDDFERAWQTVESGQKGEDFLQSGLAEQI